MESNEAWIGKACVAGTAALAVAALVALAGGAAPAAGVTAGDPLLARGEYMVKIGGCDDCHTPFKMGPHGPEPDMSRRLSGHPETIAIPPAPQLDGFWVSASSNTNTAHAGPWGISVSRNLTPDRETGLGSWTEAQFVAALRTGRHQGIPDGRPILPPMPSSYSNWTDEDFHAVWEYLKTVPAIHNAAPQSMPALPPGGGGH